MYSMSTDDLTANGNSVKESLLAALERDGVLKTGDAGELSKKYVVLVHRPSWFGRTLAALIGKDGKDTLCVTIAKIV